MSDQVQVVLRERLDAENQVRSLANQALRRDNGRLKAALLRFLIATTFDEAYTEDVTMVREEAARLLGLPAPPNYSTHPDDVDAWEEVACTTLGAWERQEEK